LIQLLHHYRGRLTNNRMIPMGQYEEDDPRLEGLAAYLVDNGHAVQVKGMAARAYPKSASDVSRVEKTEPVASKTPSLYDIVGLSARQVEQLFDAGYSSFSDLDLADDETLLGVSGIGDAALRTIREFLSEAADD
jgi:hypothetical protein